MVTLTVIFASDSHYSANHHVCVITPHLLIRRDLVEDDRKKPNMNTKWFKLPEVAFLEANYNCRHRFVSFHRK